MCGAGHQTWRVSQADTGRTGVPSCSHNLLFRVWCDRKNERCQPSDSKGFTAWHWPHWLCLAAPIFKTSESHRRCSRTRRRWCP
jgi:hypothetical protein